MKKLILSTFFIFAIVISAQELDEAYLASLPEEVRKSVQQQISDREADEAPVYRRPSTMINKPDMDSVNSERFGTQIFNMMQSSFMPVNEPNIDNSYILDFGDTLKIQLIGQKNEIEELSIERDGSINISFIGKVFLSGLSLESASSLIKDRLSNAYIGVQAYVSLVSIRDIQVLIAGNAYNPGIYTLNGNSNLLHALAMAGGIDEKGSYRQVDLIRDERVIESIDLYDTFISGKSAFGSRLVTGDSVLVRPVKTLVSASGGFNRPKVFELKPEENFEDLMNYANGFSPDADPSYLRIESLAKNEVSYTRIIESNLVNFQPKSGDTLYVKKFIYRSVEIVGAVNTPGTYRISEKETLSTLIKKAEGYKSNAYPFGGILLNTKTLEINNEAADRLYRTFVQNLITKGNALFASDSLPLILGELRNTKVSGRVMADFDLDLIDANPRLDTSLEDGDKIFIPVMTQQVYIYGEVSNPGTLRYNPGQSIKEYVKSSGGPLDSGDSKNIFVIHPNGQVNILYTRNLSLLTSSNDDLVYPGTVIYVPRKLLTKDATLIASIWAPIVSSLALSVTSLSILDK